jgi:hypothetical protein
MAAGNSLSTATNLNSSSSFQSLQDSVNSISNGSDFYSLRLSGHSSVSLKLDSLTPNGNVNFELLNSTGSTLNLNGVAQKSENSGNLLDTISIDNLSAGQYYVRVYTSSSSDASYNLSFASSQNTHADLIWRYNSNQNAAITGRTDDWQMLGNTLKQSFPMPKQVPDLDWQIEAIGDFNQDGQADLLWRNIGKSPLAGRIDIWEMDGNNLIKSTTLSPRSTDANWHVEGVGDFNADGQTDILWRYNGTTGSVSGTVATGRIDVWEMNGTSFVKSVQLSKQVSNLDWQIEGVKDFNQDGQADLLWRNVGTGGANAGRLDVWQMNNTNLTQSVTLSKQVADPNWRIEGLGDFNGDSRTDILWRNVGTGANAGRLDVWQMNGTDFVQSTALSKQVADRKWQVEGIRSRFEVTSANLAGNTLNTALNIGTLSTDGGFRGAINTVANNAYYQFTVSNTGICEVSLDGLSADANIRLLDRNGNQLAISQNSGTASESFAYFLNAGDTYYIQVVGNNSANTNYSLQFLHTGTNGFSKVGNEDATLSFAASDFTGAFSTPYNLSKVKITALPTQGSLKLNGVDVALNQEIDAAQLSNLSFVPVADFNGNVTFNWKGFNGTSYTALDLVASLTVNSVNDLPTLSNVLKSGDEDTSITFTTSDFGNHFNDVDGDNLSKIKITGLATHGTLKLGSIGVSVGQEIDATELSNLVYTPNLDYNGSDTFSWVGSDGIAYANAGALVQLTVNSVNDLPTISNISKTGIEDTQLAFSANDFISQFSDVDGSLTKIKITSLPSLGVLKLAGINVEQNQEIDVTNLGNLTYTPNNNINGADTFGWVGSDGISYATTGATVDLNISAVSDLPTLANINLSGNEDGTITFTAGDFSSKFTDVDGDSLSKIKITSLPTNGILQLGGIDVLTNQEIDVLSLGTLTFTPHTDFNGAVSFGWNGFDGSGYATNNTSVNLTINPVNDAPSVTVANQTVLESSGTHAVNLTTLAGPANEVGQTVSVVNVTNSNPSLFTTAGQPTIDANGKLVYTLADGVNGNAIVTLNLQDNGGTLNGGIDTASTTFTITAAPRSVAVGEEVFLASNYIQLGVSKTGSLGTLNSVPLGFAISGGNSNVVMRTDLDGWDQGNPPAAGDFSLPGTPEDRIVLGYRNDLLGTPSIFNNAQLMGEIDFSSTTTNTSSGNTLSATTIGTAGSLGFQQVISMGLNDKQFATTITLTNNSGTALYDVRFMRNLDPDQDVDLHGNFSTSNDVLSNPGLLTTEARVRATGTSSGVAIDFYANDPSARASSFGFANTDPYDPNAFEIPADPDGEIEDQAIAITFAIGNLAAGESRTFTYYTAFSQQSLT